MLTSLVDRFIRRFLPELRIGPKSLRYLLTRTAIESSANFIEQYMGDAQPFETREGLYKHVMRRISASGLVLEFGVHNGRSINVIASLTDRTVHGFDSFEGLPVDDDIPNFTDGGVKWYAGKMSRGGTLPDVRDNVRLHKGWFISLLPEFLATHEGKIAFMHIDCDIYSSTRDVLNRSRDRISEGTIIVFDEYMNFEGWQRHEHRALMEFVTTTDMRYEFIAYTYLGGAAIRVLGFDGEKSR
jgi:Macrocin-O-methyltransferase (TylF)